MNEGRGVAARCLSRFHGNRSRDADWSKSHSMSGEVEVWALQRSDPGRPGRKCGAEQHPLALSSLLRYGAAILAGEYELEAIDSNAEPHSGKRESSN